MTTPVTNFGRVTVSTGYNNSATSIVLTTGHGSRLPSTFPYPLTWWNFTDYPDPADDPNKEIVMVTNRSGDTLTVTRAAEGTSASTKNTASKTYKMSLGLTKAMWDALAERALSQTFRGLRVSTHPDADVDDKKVLFSADSIVMDDGEEIAGWSNVVVDLSVSGANGLDTGTEQASTWYSLWAIYNGTTKAGLFHREKNYLADSTGNYNTGEDGGHALRRASAPVNTKLNQGFQLATVGLLEFIDVKLVKAGTPTGEYWFTIETNSGGVPSGTVLATSDKYDVSRLTTTATWVRMPFRTPASLSASTQYHLVLQGNYTASDTNNLSWRADVSAASYASGSKGFYDGATWTNDTDDDFLFKTYITQNDTAVTLPTGYTQKALIGFAYNDGSSNLVPFLQVDRTVFGGQSAGWKIGSFTNTTADLKSLAAVIPPRPCLVTLFGYGDTGAATMRVGRLFAPDILGVMTTEYVGSSVVYCPAAGGMATYPPIALEYQAMMHVVQSSGGNNLIWVGAFQW